ncbi:MAG: helix-turn-helix domain-containing protein [Deferribacteres bacterium]|nr:helix-turn-helix domain-containing protein [candidate division KSB1 bacterium]MCB9503256.1 helix-turn-helix domain-containing protein [Deferribacteres bacterium]
MSEHNLDTTLPQYLPEKEVSKITGIALSTLRNDRFYGRGIPYVKIRRSVRYDLQDVIKFMNAHKIQTESYFDAPIQLSLFGNNGNED